MASAGPQTPPDSPLTMEEALASPVYRDLSTPKLSVGYPAHDFELPRVDASSDAATATGGTVRVSSFAGLRPIALIFGSYT